MVPADTYWYVACLSRELRRAPLSRVMLGQALVLFRDDEGRAQVLLDRCPHRHAPLSQGRVVAGEIQCPYHGWRFDGEGQCQKIPGSSLTTNTSKRRVPVFRAAEQDGLVWVRLSPGSTELHSLSPSPDEAPQDEPERFPLLTRAGYTSFLASDRLEGSLFDVVENFLDPTHTHFVHSGLVRSTAKRRKTRVRIEASADSVTANYLDEDAQSGLIARLFGRGIDSTRGRFRLPSAADLEYLSGTRVKLQIALRFTPIDGRKVRVFALVVGEAPPVLGRLLVPLLKALFRRVFDQDRRILRMRQRNAARHPDAPYAFSDMDLLGPYILKLLNDGPQTTVPAARYVDIWL